MSRTVTQNFGFDHIDGKTN